MTAEVMAGQTADQPAIKTLTGSTTDAPGTIVDALKYAPSGGDICTSINATWAHAMAAPVTSPTIDARGFIGAASCGQQPFPTGAKGRLLLGNVWISTAFSINVPAGVEVLGLGVSGANQDNQGSSSTPINTVIAASTSGFVGAVLEMGISNSGPQYGVKIKSLSVDCLGSPSCTGIENKLAGPGSTVEDVTISNAAVNGLRVTVGNPSSGPSATYSGPYRNITIQYFPGGCPSSSCNTSTTNGVTVDCATINSACPYVVEFDNITADATCPIPNCNPTPAAIGFNILGVPALLVNSHMENYQASNIEVGTSVWPTSGVKIENVSFNSGGGVLIGGMSSNITIVGLSTSTSATLINNFYPTRGGTGQKIKGKFLAFYAHGSCQNISSCTNGSNYLYPLISSDGDKLTNNLQWQLPSGFTY
ncbi:MAG: hypothetical protein H0X25_05110 [Acidobacteriales bacterium]|nr:hypothetical protein [Terriglobales bacterium]